MSRVEKPGRSPGGEIQIGNDDFILALEIDCAGQKIVGLGAARAEGRFTRSQADQARRHGSALFELSEVSVSTSHACKFVAPVLLQRLTDDARRDTLGGGVEINQ